MAQTNKNTASINPMTDNQRRHIFFLLKQLNLTKEFGDDMCDEWTDGRATRISKLQFIDAMTIIEHLNGFLQNPREPKNRYTVAIDKKRKGLIKAVFRWYELQGKVKTMDYVKGTICKAGGVRNINDLTMKDLQRLYAEFCKKQEVQIAINKELEITFSNN